MNKFPGIVRSTNKVNYYQQSIDEINKIKESGLRPSILLHACCAPCASFPIEFLHDYFDITIYYNNSNIYPPSEYEKRLDELKRYIQEVAPYVNLIVPPYDNENYTKKLEPLKDVPEGGQRCFLCYTLRMDEAYQYACDHNFDYFTTVMTISRQKDSQKLNEIGTSLQAKYPQVKYFHSDFKKKKGCDRSNELSKQHNLYKQTYCGCKYSYQKRKETE